jgi:hypothetical protein
MHNTASNLTQLLESDLVSSGWNPSFIGPRLPNDELYQVELASLSRSLLKKFTYEDPDKENERDKAALDLFLAKNEDCRRWSLSEKMAADDKVLQEAIGEVKASLDRFFHPEGGRGILLTFNSIAEGLDVGKGANVGHTNVDFYSKVTCSPLTSTSIELAETYRLMISRYPVWQAAEYRRELTMGTRIVTGSVLTFVPKTEKISRTICTEPLCNMLLQKGIEAVLIGRLRQFFGIDLTCQPDKNRVLARVGSRDDSYATIDLSSASDLNSISMVKEFFPPSVYRWLERSRSPYAVLPDSSVVELHMISSMGNAFTFPLQTILFACVVEAAYKMLGIRAERPYGQSLGNFAVFGDDIIVVKEAYDLVCRMLAAIGHSVNLDKSYCNGPFRESCGTDWYLGRNVRGVYIKRLDDDCDFYSAINRLNIWSAVHRVPLPLSTSYLYTLCKRKFLVPMHEVETAGIRVPRFLYEDRLPAITRKKKFFGPAYRAVVIVGYKVKLTCEESLTSEVTAYRNRTGQKVNPKASYLAKAWYNSDGHLLAALAGRLRGGYFFIREFRRRTVVKVRRSSCWDYVGPVLHESGVGEDLLVFTWLNLGKLQP